MKFKYYLKRIFLLWPCLSLLFLIIYLLPAVILKRFDFLLWMLGIQLFHIPIFFYLIGLSFVVSFVVLSVYYFIQRAQYTRLEANLYAIQTGHYHDLGRKRMRVHHFQTIHLQNIIREMEQINQQLTDVTEQVQYFNEQPVLYEGETKEEILQNERHRIARELHDSVSQQLFAATMLISALKQQSEKLQVTDTYANQLRTVSNIIEQAQSEMRALLLHLRPVSLENRSLKEGMIQLLDELITKVQLKMVWKIEDVSLPKGVEDQLFRILQEILSNVLRHAKAHTLEVYLRIIGEQLLLRVVDDGIGFDMDKVNRAGSYGMQNLKERAASIGGTVRITSFEGMGTSVEVTVPLNDKREEEAE